MDQALFFSDWRSRVVFSEGGPQPQILHEDGRVKVVVVGLEPGARIPDHPGDFGVYHFVEGSGQMRVSGDSLEVSAGGTVIVPAGAVRGMTAMTRLAFIAVRLA